MNKLSKRLLYSFIFILFIGLLVICLKPKNEYIDPIDIPNVSGIFKNINDENGDKLNVIAITSHVNNDEDKKTLYKYIEQGIKIIGVCSYLSFPRHSDNKTDIYTSDESIQIDGKYIEDFVIGWCHCFREPEKYIKGDKPRILLSESDFVVESALEEKNLEIKYDYIAHQPKDNDECELKWHGHNKNWLLAEKCIKVLSDELNLKGLIVGRAECPVEVDNKDNVEVTEFIKNWTEFLDKTRESRFILLPNLEDASPRFLTEGLALNKPIFVNENILGGWKYVNDDTGVFFNENNIKEQAETLLSNYDNYSPKEYFMNNYGEENSGKRLKEFIQSIYPDLSPCKYAKF